MPFCPKCRDEFRPGYDRCADCDAALVSELEPAEPDATPCDAEPWAIVVRTDPIGGDIIEGELAEQGIECHLEPMLAPSLTGMGYVRVLVPRKDRSAAMTVVEYLRRKFPRMALDYVGLSETPPLLPGI